MPWSCVHLLLKFHLQAAHPFINVTFKQSIFIQSVECKFTVQITVEQRPALEVGCTITAEVPRELAVMHMLKDNTSC